MFGSPSSATSLRHPYRGPRHDLHAAAHRFLKEWGFFTRSETGLKPENVFLEPTLLNKLHRIGSLGCSAFVDDLPEVLAESSFPNGVQKVLFDPNNAHPRAGLIHVTSWAACADRLLAPRKVAA